MPADLFFQSTPLRPVADHDEIAASQRLGASHCLDDEVGALVWDQSADGDERESAVGFGPAICDRKALGVDAVLGQVETPAGKRFWHFGRGVAAAGDDAGQAAVG